MTIGKELPDGSTDSAAADVATGADAIACTTTYYLDDDSDGFGGNTTACAPGASGNWVKQGGDCEDKNASVFPGQSKYFSVGYLPLGKTDLSFDKTPLAVKATSCTSGGASCTATGLCLSVRQGQRHPE